MTRDVCETQSTQSAVVQTVAGQKRSCVKSLKEAGLWNRRIGRHFGQSDMVISGSWQQRITKGRVNRCGGPRYPRNTNEDDDRVIRVATSALKKPLAST